VGVFVITNALDPTRLCVIPPETEWPRVREGFRRLDADGERWGVEGVSGAGEPGWTWAAQAAIFAEKVAERGTYGSWLVGRAGRSMVGLFFWGGGWDRNA